MEVASSWNGRKNVSIVAMDGAPWFLTVFIAKRWDLFLARGREQTKQ